MYDIHIYLCIHVLTIIQCHVPECCTRVDMPASGLAEIIGPGVVDDTVAEGLGSKVEVAAIVFTAAYSSSSVLGQKKYCKHLHLHTYRLCRMAYGSHA